MRLAPVARFVTYIHLVLAMLMLAPALLAQQTDEMAATAYAVGIVMSLFIAGASFAASQGFESRIPIRQGVRELMLTLILFWIVMPMGAAVPFIIQGYRFDDGWFEAVSALTTTGGWLSDPSARATEHGMVYRASLQWMGGFVSIATAAAVFVRPEFIGVAPIVPPFSRGESGSFVRAFDRASWTLIPVYVLITAGGMIALRLAETPWIDAVTMGFSLIASGGFVPTSGGMLSYPPHAVIVASVIMVLSAINFIVVAAILLGRGGRLERKNDSETLAFFILIPLVTFLYWIAIGAGDLDRLGPQIFNAISILSTNGETVGERPPVTPVLVTAIIGGAAISTAGGIKILRWLLTFRRSGQELWKLCHPGGVPGARPARNELGVWIHTLAFTLLLAVLVLTIAFFGYSLEVSATTAVAVISNSGPLLDLAPEMTADFAIFDRPLRALLALGMIAGRLELVALLVIFHRLFWVGLIHWQKIANWGSTKLMLQRKTGRNRKLIKNINER